MIRLAVVAAAGALVTSGPAAAAQTAALDAITAQPAVAHSIVAGYVVDLDSGATLYEHNAQTLMLAASTTKLITEGMTLATLGPQFRFTTPVYRCGTVSGDGTLHGDLVLAGSGDPNLSGRIRPDGTLAFENEDHSYDGSTDTKAVPGDPLAALRELAAQVRQAGIRRITGYVYADDRLFSGGYAENGTGATVSPVVVNDNLVDVTVTPASIPGRPPTIAVSPQTPYASFTVAATTTTSGLSTIGMSDRQNADGTHTVRITGTIPQGPSRLYAYRVPDPAAFARTAFAMTLRDAGVQARASSQRGDFRTLQRWYSPANVVAQHRSPPLSEDVYVTLKVSDNLHADLMPYAWSIYRFNDASTPLRTAFVQERAFLAGAGLDTDEAALTDGLGTDAYFTPHFMVSYLQYASKQPWFDAFQRALPILGVDGTLFDIATSLPGKGQVFAKTGTWDSSDLLNGKNVVSAKGLAGYTTTRAGHRVAFCFYLNRFTGPPGEATTKAAGQFLGALADAVYETL